MLNLGVLYELLNVLIMLTKTHLEYWPISVRNNPQNVELFLVIIAELCLLLAFRLCHNYLDRPDDP